MRLSRDRPTSYNTSTEQVLRVILLGCLQSSSWGT